MVPRATARAELLVKKELLEGGLLLTSKVRRYRPDFVAILGVGAYRVAFNRPKAIVGKQEDIISDTMVWVLPNPSGLNANYQREHLVQLLRELKTAVDGVCTNHRLAESM